MGSTTNRRLHAVSRIVPTIVPIAAALLIAGPGTVHAAGNASTEQHQWRAASDAELRSIWARGFTERLFDHPSSYVAGGNAVTILGNMAVLLNPFLGFLDADTNFASVTYDPDNPTAISARDGSVFLRLPKSIGEINFRNLRVSGTNGASFGDVSLRNIDSGGTTVKVTYRR